MQNQINSTHIIDTKVLEKDNDSPSVLPCAQIQGQSNLQSQTTHRIPLPKAINLTSLFSLVKDSSVFHLQDEDDVDSGNNKEQSTSMISVASSRMEASSTLRNLLTTPNLKWSDEMTPRRHSTTSLSLSTKDSLSDDANVLLSLNKHIRLINSVSSSVSASPIASPCTSPRRALSPCDIYRVASPDMVQDNDTQMSYIRQNCRDLNLGGSCSDSATDDGGGFFSESGRLHHSDGLNHWENSAIPAKQRRSLYQSHVFSASVVTGVDLDVIKNDLLLSSSYNARSLASSSLIKPSIEHLCADASSSSSTKFRSKNDSTFCKKLPRLPSLTTPCPNQHGQMRLVILSQPEEQHRARYMTEGSRGAVKDRLGMGYPIVQLYGWNQPTTLQVFVGSLDDDAVNDVTRCKPHGFYRVSKVVGKNCAAYKERQFEHTSVLEVQLDPAKSMRVVLDCIGIVKLRNADVEQPMVGGVVEKMRKRSTSVRLVFRVNLARPDDATLITLQVASQPILCTQAIGCPEISRMSLLEGSSLGGQELFIIGKHFGKATRVVFQKLVDGQGVIWQSDADIEIEFLHQSHLIARTPPYYITNIREPVSVQVVVQTCATRVSEPRFFTYLPDHASNSTFALNALSKRISSTASLASQSTARPNLATISIECDQPVASQFNYLNNQIPTVVTAELNQLLSREKASKNCALISQLARWPDEIISWPKSAAYPATSASMKSFTMLEHRTHCL